jgi:hypothetical protein
MHAAMLQSKLMGSRAHFLPGDNVFVVYDVEEFIHNYSSQKSKVKSQVVFDF